MTSYTKDNVTTTYTYTASGLRESKTSGGVQTFFAWDDGNMILEYVVTDPNYLLTTYKNLYAYGADGIAFRKTEDGSVYTYNTNYRGDVISIMDDGQNAVLERIYDAYGMIIDRNENRAFTDNFGYRGQYHDAESGYIYLRNRYLDPETGRFISEDPIRDGLNWFVYCEGNPIKSVDLWGLEPGDFFLTEEDAAKDFANIYNPVSIKNDVEYATFIYSFTGMTEINGKAVVGTYYTYGVPAKGTSDSANVALSSNINYNSATRVAIAHTHGRYKQEYKNETFSGNDIGALKKTGVNRIYLATPGGYLKCFDANTSEAKRIAQVPFDKNSPDKPWWRIFGGVSY